MQSFGSSLEARNGSGGSSESVDPRHATSQGGLFGAPEPDDGGANALWPARWASLAAASGLNCDRPLLLALSGGADSVLLAWLACQARPRLRLRAVHVDHGLRGAESDADARFCAELCARWGLDLRVRRIELDPRRSGLEERARRLRYRALIEAAREFGGATILTAHHADDALETLLLRWTRGTRTGGLAGLAARRGFRGLDAIEVVRPLIGLRRDELRAWSAEAGLAHREDSSNADLAFARNRIRRELLPTISAAVGPEAIENLFAFARAVQGLETALEQATAHLSWRPAPFERARGAAHGPRAGRLDRGALMAMNPSLRRRGLARLLLVGAGRSPGQALLDAIAEDLERGRCTRHALPGGWSLQLRSAELVLEPPPQTLAELSMDRSGDATPPLPFPQREACAPQREFRLTLPSDSVRLPDGRRLSAQVLRPSAPRAVPRGECTVELDLAAVLDPRRLCVRYPRPGDRFHALGAPGTKPLTRFLADRGIPRGERGHVPLVACGERILWVAGVRPSQAARVQSTTEQRLRLELDAD